MCVCVCVCVCVVVASLQLWPWCLMSACQLHQIAAPDEVVMPCFFYSGIPNWE